MGAGVGTEAVVDDLCRGVEGGRVGLTRDDYYCVVPVVLTEEQKVRG